MMRKVSIYRRWTGAAPPGVPRSQWPRKRKHVWIVRWCTPDGSMPQITCSTRKEAEQVRSEKEVEFGRLPASRKQPQRITLGAFVDEYRKLRLGPKGQRLRISTLTENAAALQRLCDFASREATLDHITSADVTRFHAWLQRCKAKNRADATLAPATINKINRALRSAFSVAMKRLGYIRVNPFAGFRCTKVAKTSPRYVDRSEFEALLQAARTLGTERRERMEPRLESADSNARCSLVGRIARIDAKRLWWQVFIAVGYTGGLRLGETVNLVWADVDFADHRLRIIAKPDVGELQGWQPKDTDARTVPIPAMTVDLLARMHAQATSGNPYVLIPDDRLEHVKRASMAALSRLKRLGMVCR